MSEFDCCECGQHIIAIVADKPPEPPLCAMCLYMPGWHEHGVISGILDPGRAWPWPKGI